MTYSVPRAVVNAFYEAYASHDTVRIAQLLHDDIEWTISGPVDVLAWCGTRRGKAAVIDLVDRVIPSLFRVSHLVQEAVLVDGDCAATLNRMSARRCDDGRVISYRLAHF
ncbi:MAG TPA: nuclear transport factor 2 family protein, partial [Rhizomicrobium sp.]